MIETSNDAAMNQTSRRRRFLGRAAGLMSLAASPSTLMAAAMQDASSQADQFKPRFADRPALVPIDARPDRIVNINVCTRPFRAAGPRIEVERIAGRTVVHNYGHGGSGWSLSWGSAAAAIGLVRLAPGSRIAVIGCGAIGLTSALTAQRAGLKVRIYTRERPPDVRSSGASGVWSPDSRVCTLDGSTPEFERRWEAMARHSFRVYQNLLGLPGDPIEWRDGYVLSDIPFEQSTPREDGEPQYPTLELRLLGDIRPRSQPLSNDENPFSVPFARRYTQMVFNISAYSRMLVEDFQRAGGEIVTHEFDSPRQFASLPEGTIVNATGYGARALLGDESIVPVRGQTARLVPQPAVTYGITYRGHNLSVVPRRDGILVQAQAEGDFGNADVRPDRQASDDAVMRLAALFPHA
jgi:glycine/D-amino acid oxidase-like deaminating enzyme